MKNSLNQYFKWILSFIFISAGVLKIFSPENTGDILIFLFETSYEASLFIVYFLASIEIILGTFLFLGYLEKLIRRLVLLACSIFLGIAILGFSNGWEFACGCFGRFSFGRFDSSMVMRNTLLVAMSLWMIYGETIIKKLPLKGLITNNQIGANHED